VSNILINVNSKIGAAVECQTNTHTFIIANSGINTNLFGKSEILSNGKLA